MTGAHSILEEDVTVRSSAMLVLLCMLALLAIPAPEVHAAGTILYVMRQPQGAFDCSSWSAACDLDTALSRATPGDEIWVQQGTYYPFPNTSPDGTFFLKSGVAVYGGFNGTETALSGRNWTTNVTVLSGNSGAPARNWHVVTADGTSPSTRLDGFTITGGDSGWLYNNRLGAGIWVRNGGSLTIANCMIFNNSADLGAGVFQDGVSGSLDIRDSIIQVNKAEFGGGGVWATGNVRVDNTRFVSNTVDSGNSTDTYGGGLYAQSSAAILNSTFRSNSTNCSLCINSGGGGVWAHVAITVENSTFDHNSAARFGGGLDAEQVAVVKNSTFYRNIKGGFRTGSRPASVIHSTFVENIGDGIYHAGGGLTVRNSLVWGNSTGQIPGTLNITVSDSVVQGGFATGTHIITGDPHLGSFGELWGGSTAVINLYAPSSAIDTASDAYCLPTDQRGFPRPAPPGGHCDIGAFERQPNDWSPFWATFLPLVAR